MGIIIKPLVTEKMTAITDKPVSYTHLDVYKRQGYGSWFVLHYQVACRC